MSKFFQIVHPNGEHWINRDLVTDVYLCPANQTNKLWRVTYTFACEDGGEQAYQTSGHELESEARSELLGFLKAT